jgi:hypothetical protein
MGLVSDISDALLLYCEDVKYMKGNREMEGERRTIQLLITSTFVHFGLWKFHTKLSPVTKYDTDPVSKIRKTRERAISSQLKGAWSSALASAAGDGALGTSSFLGSGSGTLRCRIFSVGSAILRGTWN